MVRTLLFFLTAAAALAAGDPWAKVRDLKSGTEIRVYKARARQPLIGKIDEAREDSLVIVIKNEQVAIPRTEIDRLDYRPVKPGGRVTAETKSKMEEPDPQGSRVPSNSTSTNVTIGSKPDFETIYRRPPPAPRK